MNSIRRHLKNTMAVCLSLLLFLTSLTKANTTGACDGKFFDLFTNLCWDCLFPLTIGSMTLVSGKNPDTDNPGNPVCVCMKGIVPHFGASMGYWEPAYLVDVTRHPYCLVNLGGWTFPNIIKRYPGTVSDYSSAHAHSFYYVHYYDIGFPIAQGGACPDDFMPFAFLPFYFSELDPVWNNEKLAAALYPENQIIASQAVANTVLCGTECTKVQLPKDNLPIDSLFWCAGCQGSLYPATGSVQEHVNSIQATTLMVERADFILHREDFIEDNSKDQLCHESYQARLPKSRYRYQMVYPVKSPRCYVFGDTPYANWTREVIKPTSSEDYGYIVYKKRNCCAY